MSELCYLSATEMLAAIRNRSISVLELTQAHIQRCEQVNPLINALVTPTFEAALEQARKADALLAQNSQPEATQGKLFGLPVAHKDNFATQGVRTTYGSLAFKDNIPTSDSIVVARQKQAGAISLGKTNLPELGAGSHTFNDVFGITRNPYDLKVSAGGSSGGSAAALAAGLVPLADGSDLGGSLRNPASFCNVVGLRPSLGRVANGPGSFPFNTMSVAGPMGRNVADVALYLDVLAGEDPQDPMAVAAPAGGYAKLQPLEPKGVRIAISRTLGGLPFEPAVLAGLDEGIAHLQSMGCILEEDEPDFSQADFVFETLRALIFSSNYRVLRQSKGELFKDAVRWNIDLADEFSGATVGDAERARGLMFGRMRQLFSRHDFLIAPVSQVLPFAVEQEYPTEIAGEPMPHYLGWMRSSSRISITGHPSISIPCTFSPDGRPIGIQIIGRYRDEARLLAFAQQFENTAKSQLTQAVTLSMEKIRHCNNVPLVDGKSATLIDYLQVDGYL